MPSSDRSADNDGDMTKNVLEEADEITQGVRAKTYGSAKEGAERFAQIASAGTGLDVKPEHLPVIMIAVKLSRIASADSWHRDSWVDLAGYARVSEMIEQGTSDEWRPELVDYLDQLHKTITEVRAQHPEGPRVVRVTEAAEVGQPRSHRITTVPPRLVWEVWVHPQDWKPIAEHEIELVTQRRRLAQYPEHLWGPADDDTAGSISTLWGIQVRLEDESWVPVSAEALRDAGLLPSKEHDGATT